MDELARILGLHPVLHLRVGIEAKEIVNERERIVELGIPKEYLGKRGSVIVDAQPPEDFADFVKMAIDFSHGFWKDDDVFGAVR